VAYAVQSLNYTHEVPAPYDGFADGPIIQSASLTGTALTMTFAFADGMAFKPTFDCGVGGYAGDGNGCCTFNRTFEVSSQAIGDWRDDSLWQPVPATAAVIAHGTDGMSSVTLTLPEGHAALRVRYAHQMYPQCVLSNSRQLIAGPFVSNVTQQTKQEQTQPADDRRQSLLSSHSFPPSRLTTDALTDGIALTPPMGFNSWNFYHCNIDERAIRQIAQTLNSTGLAALGYKYGALHTCSV
jgi:hypothetical protein